MSRFSKTTTYGQKGGEGPTKGLKATTYSITTPDGKCHRKRTFSTNNAIAVAECYEHAGTWYIACINPVQKYPHYTPIAAVRFS